MNRRFFIIISSLFILAIPLNIFGFWIKKKTKIHNKLIPIMIMILSWLVCGLIGVALGKNLSTILGQYSLFNGTLISTVATHGWDSTYGIKTILTELVKKEDDFFLGGKVNLTKLREIYKFKILNNFLSFIAVLAITNIVLFLLKSNVTVMFYYSYIILSSVLYFNILKDFINNKKYKYYKINKYYYVLILLALTTMVTTTLFLLGNILILKVISGISTLAILSIGFVVFNYYYLPELVKQPAILQDILQLKWKDFESTIGNKESTTSDIANYIIDSGYYFESDTWNSRFNFQCKVKNATVSENTVSDSNVDISLKENVSDEPLRRAKAIVDSFQFYKSFSQKEDL